MSNRGCRAPGGIRCREGPGRLSGLLTRNKLALENVIQVNLSASINCTVFGCTAQAPAAGLAAPSPVPRFQLPPM